MASCSEVDHSVDALASGKKVGGDSVTGSGGSGSSSPSSSPALPILECAICLQSCIHPVRLPCRHVFCFLCVKGASWHSKRCALCRQEVPEDFLERPTLLSPEELKASASGVRGTGAGDYAWYYEGRNGWWQYDERTSRELEDALAKGKKSTEMLIAGFLYVADLENMVQYRRNEHGRRRRMKRDVVDIPKKGVAGLRLDPEPGNMPVAAVEDGDLDGGSVMERESSADGADSGASGGRSQGLFAAPPVRPHTVLGGHPSSPDSPSPPSLVHALDQLNISPGEEEEEEGEDADDEDDGAAPEASGYESGSYSSEEEEDEEQQQRGAERGGGWAESSGNRHRLQQPDRLPPGGGSSSGASSVCSRSPDGQCTVTEV
ncbi:E3 ubiquitin-protein ligase rnf146 [Chanos chanos]|uniref:E3 ubiquitin-protein ligase n=1 Tax=Chanos chanos TaxID=29144 RepID=A0A6J2WBI1_CHACN|nr:E3 ubiquitin-protein ligase rnf146-like [Chanos chanos]